MGFTGALHEVQVVQVRRPPDILDHGAEGSSSLLLVKTKPLPDGPEKVGLGGDIPVILVFFFDVFLFIPAAVYASTFASTFATTFVTSFGNLFLRVLRRICLYSRPFSVIWQVLLFLSGFSTRPLPNIQ